MGLLDKLTGKAKREEEARLAAEAEKKRLAEERKAKREAKKAEEAAKPKAKKKQQTINPDKIAATERGEPWVSVMSVELDPDNIGNGAFELDWNDKFIVSLVKAGYQTKAGEEESVIVDRWFQDVCRNVVLENFEQWEANQPRDRSPIQRKDLGDGRTEIS